MDLEKEKQIVALCKQDLSYFTTIYDLFFKDVYRYCFCLTNRKETAEDAVSNTFLKALENIQNFEYQDKSIKYWLFVIARNTVYKSTQNNFSNEVIDEDITEDSESILDILIDEVDKDKLNQSLETLEVSEQELVRLKIWEELTFEEISKVVNTSVSACKMKYYRLLDKLKKLLV